MRLREVISLLKNTELMNDRVQGFGTVFFPSHCSTPMWWLIYICLTSIPTGPLYSPCCPAPCPGLPHVGSLVLLTQLDLPKARTSRGKEGREGRREWGVTFPFPLFSRQCFLQWLYFSTTSGFCQQALFPVAVLTGSKYTSSLLCLFTSEVICLPTAVIPWVLLHPQLIPSAPL